MPEMRKNEKFEDAPYFMKWSLEVPFGWEKFFRKELAHAKVTEQYMFMTIRSFSAIP